MKRTHHGGIEICSACKGRLTYNPTSSSSSGYRHLYYSCSRCGAKVRLTKPRTDQEIWEELSAIEKEIEEIRIRSECLMNDPKRAIEHNKLIGRGWEVLIKRETLNGELYKNMARDFSDAFDRLIGHPVYDKMVKILFNEGLIKSSTRYAILEYGMDLVLLKMEQIIAEKFPKEGK